jgi:hypothetical protein
MDIHVAEGIGCLQSSLHLTVTRFLPDVDRLKIGRDVLVYFKPERLSDSQARGPTEDEERTFFGFFPSRKPGHHREGV